MVLKDEALCKHSTYHGNTENRFFRGANAPSRYVTCKERDCKKVVIKGERADAVDLWQYLVMIALTTRRGKSLRSHGLFQRVCHVRGDALEAQERGLPGDGSASGSPTSPTWQLLGSSRSPGSPPAISGNASSSGGYPQAKVKRQHDQCFWLYGVRLMLGEDLPSFPGAWRRGHRRPADSSI